MRPVMMRTVWWQGQDGSSFSSCPILWQSAIAHMAVKGGMRPVLHPAHQPLPDRIEVDVIDVIAQIGFVAAATRVRYPLTRAQVA